MQRYVTIAVVAAFTALAACGETDLERGASGAAIGGLGAAALDGNVAAGAIAGGAAGVFCDDVRLC